MSNNFIKTRESENSKLLSLLTKRQKQSTLTEGFQSIWPGKLRPSFTSSLKILQKSQKQIKRKHSQRCLRTNIIKHIASVQTSPKTLSLRPSTVGWQTQRNTARYSWRQGTTKQKLNIIKIEQNASENSFTMFKNSKISKRMSQVLSSKLLSSKTNETPLKISHKQNQQKTFKFTGQILQATKSKQTNRYTQQQKTHPSQQQFELQQSSRKDKRAFSTNKKQQAQYKIDFFAFNYINKVVDNPELWMKYVHKVKKNQ